MMANFMINTDLSADILNAWKSLAERTDRAMVASETEADVFRYYSGNGLSSATMRGVGTDFVYDSDDSLVSGNVEVFENRTSTDTAGGPNRVREISVANVSFSIADTETPGFWGGLLDGDNEVILLDPTVGQWPNSMSVSTGDGDDTVHDRLTSVSGIAARGSIDIDLGSGSDTLYLGYGTRVFDITLGEGADTINQYSFDEAGEPVGLRTVKDFDPSVDKVRILDADSQVLTNDGAYGLKAVDDGVLLQIVSAEPADVLLLKGITLEEVKLENGVISGTGMDPADPIDPVDPVDPVDPIDPTDPVDPKNPWDQTGTEGDDFLYGTVGDDVLKGEGGSDHLLGEGGRDSLHGGSGDDFLFGGAGEDRLWGDEGDDYLTGGEGDDFLDGGAGNDVLEDMEGDNTLQGGAGDDVILAGDGADTIFGGFGNDWVYGGGGSDNIFASSSNDAREEGDHLDGQDGDDFVHGASGDDTLLGGAGDDYLEGGQGDDWFYGGEGHDGMMLGEGRDTVVFEHGADGGSCGNDTAFGFTSGEDSVYFENAAITADNIRDHVIETEAGVLIIDGKSSLLLDELNLDQIDFDTDFAYTAPDAYA